MGRSIDELSAILTQHFESWARALTPEQRGALLDWQTTRHEMVNDLLRQNARDPTGSALEVAVARHGEEQIRDLLAAVAALTEACSREVTPFELTVYRGVTHAGHRQLLEALGVSSLRPGDVIVEAAFVATSVYEAMATSRMGAPGDALLLELFVPAGVAAAWLPAATDVIDQGELLFAPRTAYVVRDVGRLGQDARVRADMGVY